MQADPAKPAESEATDLVVAGAEIIKALRAATDPAGPGGARITKQEATELARLLDDMATELAEARAAVEALKSGSLTGLRNRKP